MDKRIFPYGEKEVAYLKKKDKKLGAAIERIGIIEREVTLDLFTALVHSVISQQISSKAADTVFMRLSELCGSQITPQKLDMLGIEEIQKCGMSMRKAEYLKEITKASISGELDFNALSGLSDEAVIKLLVSIRGVGVWTAEMMLIFSLMRGDVVSYSDLAIRRGMMNLYGLEALTKAEFEKYRKRYSPYGTVASLYLWALS